MFKKKKEIKKDNENILQEKTLFEELEDTSLAEQFKEKKKLEKKRNRKRWLIIIFITFFSVLLYWGLMPFEATVPYGLCKILIELNIPYPQTLKFSEVSELRNGDIRIWFTHIDAFGAFRQESFVCSFVLDEETQKLSLEKARWGMLDLEQRSIDQFNQVIPVLLAGEYYDTTYPIALPDSLNDLKFDIDKYRKVNLMGLISEKR